MFGKLKTFAMAALHILFALIFINLVMEFVGMFFPIIPAFIARPFTTAKGFFGPKTPTTGS